MISDQKLRQIFSRETVFVSHDRRMSPRAAAASTATKLIQTHIPRFDMATDGDAPENPPEADMLPDERAVIAERVDELENKESHRSVNDVAEGSGSILNSTDAAITVGNHSSTEFRDDLAAIQQN